MKKKILGTGLTGLVGSRIVELLGNQFDFEDLAFEKGFDITKREKIEGKIADSSAGILIHLAAFTDVNAAWNQRNDKTGFCYQINVVGTKNIAKICAKYRKFLIHFSTDFVFNGKKDEPYTEEDISDSIEWYGKTKYLAEEVVKKAGCQYCIVRISFPFRTNYPPKSDLIRKIVDGLKNKTLYPQFNDQLVTPTFIDDIARGIKIILEEKPEGIYHLVGSSFISPYDLARKVAKIFGFEKDLVREGKLVDYLIANPSSRPYQKSLALSNKKIQGLGIKMRSIDEALRELKRQGLVRS